VAEKERQIFTFFMAKFLPVSGTSVSCIAERYCMHVPYSPQKVQTVVSIINNSPGSMRHSPYPRCKQDIFSRIVGPG